MYLCAYVYVCVRICLRDRLYTYFCLSVCLSIYLSCLFVCLPAPLTATYLALYRIIWFGWLAVCAGICLGLYLWCLVNYLCGLVLGRSLDIISCLSMHSTLWSRRPQGNRSRFINIHTQASSINKHTRIQNIHSNIGLYKNIYVYIYMLIHVYVYMFTDWFHWNANYIHIYILCIYGVNDI